MTAVLVAGLAPLVEPGFFSSPPVRTALEVGALTAVVSAVVGVFTVVRGQSFAGHALADTGTAGGAAAFLAGVSTVYGFVAFNVVAAAVMEVIGVRRARERDLATGIVLGASLGLAALFLYEDSVHSATSGATVHVLFGSIFTLPGGTASLVAVLGAASLALVAVLYRPLLLTSVSYELAAVRRVPVRLVGACFLLAMALAVSMSALTIGAILSTALLIGPAATALRLVKGTAAAIATAGAIGVVACWSGTLVAYDSVVWMGGQGWPVSFCIVAVIFVLYLGAGAVSTGRNRRGAPRRRPQPHTAEPAVLPEVV